MLAPYITHYVTTTGRAEATQASQTLPPPTVELQDKLALSRLLLRAEDPEAILAASMAFFRDRFGFAWGQYVAVCDADGDDGDVLATLIQGEARTHLHAGLRDQRIQIASFATIYAFLWEDTKPEDAHLWHFARDDAALHPFSDLLAAPCVCTLALCRVPEPADAAGLTRLPTVPS